MEIIILFVLFGISACQWGKWRSLYKRHKEEQLQESDKLNKEYIAWALNRQIEYSTLQSQINPHFLYNTLDSIRGEALLSGNESIAKMTERLSRFFRYCISNKGDMVTIRDEIHNILDYFYIQEYRFGSKFQLQCEIEEECYTYKIPKMSLQPIVENAIYHGLEQTKHGGKVMVHIFETEKNVKIDISDNGMGIEEKKLHDLNEGLSRVQYSGPKHEDAKGGIALKNVNARIRLQYGEEYGVHVRSVEGEGTSVNMVIPKMNKEYVL